MKSVENEEDYKNLSTADSLEIEKFIMFEPLLLKG
jgi:hypothetical protein